MIKSPWVIYQCPECESTATGAPSIKMICEHPPKKEKGNSRKIVMHPIASDYAHAPKEVIELVHSEDYFNVLLVETNKRIVGEETAKKALILLALGGRLVINAKPTSYNLLASAPSGTGKDALCSAIIGNSRESGLLPKGFYTHETRLSPQALAYWHPKTKEPFYSWDGRVCYVEDVTNTFLNSDTVKTMMTGGSSIVTVKDGVALPIEIEGSPIFVLTSATAEQNRELSRRVVALPLDASAEQTKRVLEFSAQMAESEQEPYNEHIVNSAYLLNRVRVLIPFAKQIRDAFPINLDSRTHFYRFLDFVRASTALHQFSRQKTAEGVVIAETQDFERAREVYQTLFSQGTVSLPHTQKAVLDFLREAKRPFSASELFRMVGINHYAQIGVMIKGLRSLCAKGLVTIQEGYDLNGKLLDLYKCENAELLTSLTSLTLKMTYPTSSKEGGNTPEIGNNSNKIDNLDPVHGVSRESRRSSISSISKVSKQEESNKKIAQTKKKPLEVEQEGIPISEVGPKITTWGAY